MTYSDVTTPAVSFGSLATNLISKFATAGFLGLKSGYRAFLVYDALSNKSDAALERLGIARNDIAHVAKEEIIERHAG